MITLKAPHLMTEEPQSPISDIRSLAVEYKKTYGVAPTNIAVDNATVWDIVKHNVDEYRSAHEERRDTAPFGRGSSMVKPPLDDAINSCHRGLDGMSVTVLAKIDGAPTQDVPASFVLVTNRDGIRELEDAYDPEG